MFDLLISGHRVMHVHRSEDLINADFCFYLSFSQIISQAFFSKFSNNLVIRESDLPHGRGWSPLTSHISEPKDEISTVLFEASG